MKLFSVIPLLFLLKFVASAKVSRTRNVKIKELLKLFVFTISFSSTASSSKLNALRQGKHALI
jgi:hypothetical protein